MFVSSSVRQNVRVGWENIILSEYTGRGRGVVTLHEKRHAIKECKSSVCPILFFALNYCVLYRVVQFLPAIVKQL